MAIRVSTPDGGIAEFPDGTPTEVIESALQQKFGAPVSTAGDVAKSAGVGVGKGVLGIIGLPGDLTSLGSQILPDGQSVSDSVDWMLGNENGESGFFSDLLKSTGTAALNQFGLNADQHKLLTALLPDSGEVQTFVEDNVTGEFYRPKTEAGEWAETIGEFVPGLASGGTTGLVKTGVKQAAKELGKRAIIDVAAPGVASEGAAKVTEALGFDAASPYARLAGAIAGGAAGGKAIRAGEDIAARAKLPAGTPDPFKPTVDDIAQRAFAIKGESQAAYRAVEDAGVTLNPAHMKGAFGTIRADIIKETGLGSSKLLAKNMPAVSSNLKTLDELAKTPLTLDGLDKVRQTIRDNVPKTASATELKFNQKLIDKIDEYIASLEPKDVISAKGPTDEAAESLLKARELWGTSKKLEKKAKIVDDIYEDALDAVGANYTVAGIQTALRQRFRKLAKDIRKDDELAKIFTEEEADIISGIVRGDTAENLTRALGKSAPESLTGMFYKNAGPGAAIGSGLGIDPVTGGLVGSAFGVGVGLPAKRAAERMTEDRLQDLIKSIYHDGNVPLTPAKRKLMDSLIGLSAGATVDERLGD